MTGATEQELSEFINLKLTQKKLQDEAKAVADVLLLYKNFYPQSKIADSGLVLYAVSLVRYGFSIMEVNLAMERLVKTNTFFPSLAEIVKAIESIEKAATGTGEKDFDEAWAEVNAEVKRCFSYSEPVFSSPAIVEAVHNLGWDSLIYMSSGNVSTVRAQFERFYKTALERKKERETNIWLLHQAGNDAVLAIAERVAAKRNLIAELDKPKKSQPSEGTDGKDGPIPIGPPTQG